MTRPASYNRVWAGSADSDQMGGETTTGDQTVIMDGWIGTATAAPPTARMQNYWQIRVDLGLQELERQGFLSWRTDVAYQIGVVVSYAGYLFQAFSANTGITPQGSSDIGIWSLIQPGKWPTTTDNITGTLPVAKGGTGGTTQSTARSGIGAAASGANSDITSLSGLTTPLSIAQGGTGANGATAARTNLGLGTAATYTAGNAVGNLAPIGWDYAVDSGVANAYVLTLSPAITAYAEPLTVRGRVAHTSTGACTLNVGGGAKALIGLGHAPLQGGEMFAGGYFEAAYIAALDKFVLLFCTGAPGQVAPATQSQHAVSLAQLQASAANYAVGSGTANALVATLSPAPASLASIIGAPIRIKVGTLNTGAVTLALNGFTTTPIVNPVGTALVEGQLPAGAIATMIYDGSNFQLQSVQTGFGVHTMVVFGVGTTPWTCPAGVYWGRLRGMGGAGTGASGNGSNQAGAGGGGAGYGEGWYPLVPGNIYSAVVGAGGTPPTTASTTGVGGGLTSFGALLTCGGGGGGAIYGGAGGAGGTVTGAQFYVNGNAGSAGTAAQGGNGGSSYGSTMALGSTLFGSPGQGPGGAGSGALAASAGNSLAANGFLTIEY